MAQFSIDEQKVESYTLPYLEKSKTLLKETYSSCESLKSLLSDSKFHSTISSMMSNINDIETEIEKSKKNLESKKDYSNKIETEAEGKSLDLFSRISAIFNQTANSSNNIEANNTSASSTINSENANITEESTTGAKQSTSFVSKVTTFFSNVGNKIKETGATIVNAATSFVKNVGAKAAQTYTTVKNWASEKITQLKESSKQLLQKTGAFVSKASSVVTTAVQKVNEVREKVNATFANINIALTMGVVKLAESIVDLVALVGGCVGTLWTGLYDIGKGIITGNFEWSATKELWKGVKSFVAYDATSKLKDWIYSTEIGKKIDENSYAPFKSTGTGYKICEGVGFVAGVVVISIFTFGAGGVAIGATATIGSTTISAGAIGLTMAAASIGKYTEAEWNKNKVYVNDGENDVALDITYEKYQEIEKLKEGESTTFKQTITNEDGTTSEVTYRIESKGNGEYIIYDQNNNQLNFSGIKESSTAGGLAKGVLYAAEDGLKAYAFANTAIGLVNVGQMAVSVGGGNIISGIKQIGSGIINTSKSKIAGLVQGVKSTNGSVLVRALSSVGKKAAISTFKDAGTYVDMAGRVIPDIEQAIDTGELNVAKIGGHIVEGYASSYMGNFGKEYTASLKENVEKLANEGYTVDSFSKIVTKNGVEAGAIKNSESDIAICGRANPPEGKGYIDVAQEMGGAYFQHDEATSAYWGIESVFKNQDELYADYNKGVIKDGYMANPKIKTIYFTQDPTSVPKTSYTFQEFKTMADVKGYDINSESSMLDFFNNCFEKIDNAVGKDGNPIGQIVWKFAK